ncbi:hypothetical protein V491_06310 [Pseudogymnoascus sp. VKM F-3775]|nr:hypothetical protein V491_06310 [Pseudogymnoascus sp. VKM F-3775]
MKATTHPGIDINDEKGDKNVPRAFIDGVRGSPIPLTEFTHKEIKLATTGDFPSKSSAHVIIAAIDSFDPEGTDLLNVHVPPVKHTTTKPEQHIQQCMPTTVADILAGSQVPTIDITLNSATIMSIQEHTHSRGRIEFATVSRTSGIWDPIRAKAGEKGQADISREVS